MSIVCLGSAHADPARSTLTRIEASPKPGWDKWRLERGALPKLDVYVARDGERRPLVVLIQGSKCYPLFSYRDRDGKRTLVTQLIFGDEGDSLTDPKVHLAAVERRGLQSFGARPTERPQCTDQFGAVTKPDRVQDVADAVLALSRQPWVDGVLLVGHSEGADVASGVAKRLKDEIKAVALLGGAGATQFFDFVAEAHQKGDWKQVGRAFGDLIWMTGGSANGRYNGLPIERWKTFAIDSTPLDDLRPLTVPVFVAQGGADGHASVEGSDVMVLELLRDARRKVSYLVLPDDDHDFMSQRTHEDHRVKVLHDFIVWALDPDKQRSVEIEGR
jgi:pimeloyl-ACP methyl ester carboxylesterase